MSKIFMETLINQIELQINKYKVRGETSCFISLPYSQAIQSEIVFKLRKREYQTTLPMPIKDLEGESHVYITWDLAATINAAKNWGFRFDEPVEMRRRIAGDIPRRYDRAGLKKPAADVNQVMSTFSKLLATIDDFNLTGEVSAENLASLEKWKYTLAQLLYVTLSKKEIKRTEKFFEKLWNPRIQSEIFTAIVHTDGSPLRFFGNTLFGGNEPELPMDKPKQ